MPLCLFYLMLENCDNNVVLLFVLPVNFCEERRKKRQIDVQLKDKSAESQNTGVFCHPERCVLYNRASINTRSATHHSKH